MHTIIVDLNQQNKNITLSGDIKQLCQNRFALRYIKDSLTTDIKEDNIVISFNENSPEHLLSKISSMLKRFGFSETKSDNTEKVLLDFYEEEQKFYEFSKKALDIRNNNCNNDEFLEFTNSVAKNLPNRTLYALQLLSAYHMAFSQNSCNFSVPGAGKTSIVYGAYSYLKNLTNDNNKKVDKILIVGPLSSFGPWELEYKECFGRMPTVKRLVSSQSKQNKIDYLFSMNTSELTLISYASVSSLIDGLIWFLKYNRVMVILDEAHKIKNTNGGVNATSVLKLAKYCKSRVVLTGTPAPNGYEDLYNLFKFVWPNKNIVGFQLNQMRDMSSRKNDVRINHLIEGISPYFIRIKKSDLNIPEAINHPPIEVEMSEKQRRIYDFIEKKYIESIISNNEMDLSSQFKANLVNAKLIRLMQASTNPSLLNTPLDDFFENIDIVPEAYRAIDDSDIIKEIMNYSEYEVPPKFKVVKNLIEDKIKNGEKIIIWASYIKTILDLKEFLEDNGIKCQELYGSIPVEQNGLDDTQESIEVTREKIIRDFHDDKCSYKVIIANPFAVAESISLHKACHTAIYLERTFNAAHFIQSKDRIHRYGLRAKDETHYYYLLSKNSIDETINERLAIKEKRMIEIMESMPIPLFDNVSSDFGDDDIKAMIRDYVRRTKKI
ncbi:DEAD/DEAH box helicase [Sedimentibacter saalensis]|uniref:DEAD/DEAH box helicase n=1 Tax=Sedimentibacter saalensis TaxID=130788 RepID=UPI002896ABC6|nr:DEAD/DEAH box helicase [Sedimentibacter saalensis]